MEKSIHQFAATGFQAASDAYERGRPEYPPEAVSQLIQELCISSQTYVVDLGAGTGKLTKLLAKTNAKITAVEPVEAMRNKFHSILPEVEILQGTAESIPLETGSVDAVVVAQAFHWFRGSIAVPEIHRILKPNGKLGLIWNARDEHASWVAKLTEVLDRYENGAPRYKSGLWKNAFLETNLFTPFHETHFKYSQHGDISLILDRVGSISFIASLSVEEKNKALDEVKKIVTDEMQMSNISQIELPYRTDVYICQKKSF